MQLEENLIRLTPFGRECGVVVTVTSAIPSFNLGLNVNDCEQAVMARRRKLSTYLGSEVVFTRQVHGVKVIDAEQAYCLDSEAEADAVVSASPIYSPGILTADCLPVVLVAFDRGRAVATCVAHAGWRGLCSDVIAEAVDALTKLTASKVSIQAWLGPCIGPQSFEVGAEVKLAFKEAWGCVDYAFRRQPTADKYLGDLQALACQQLNALNVSLAGRLEEDTFTDRRWYSHRASQQAGAPVGRFATVAQLLP